MKKKFQNIFSLLIVGLLMFTACTDDWEEMNEDPNSPTTVPATNLLGNGIRYFGEYYYDAWFNMNNVSTYAGHLGKIQYVDEARYEERESVINAAWQDLYRVAIDLENAKKFARQEGNPNLEAAALTFQSLVFQIGTDSWRDMPFTDAISGLNEVTNPEYDEQETIYPALMDSLAKANEMFDPESQRELGAGDLLFEGDVIKWQKFANSLRLRMANRIASVYPDAVTIRSDILTDDGTYPIMESNDDNAFLYWTVDAPYREPWFADMETRDDHAVATFLIDYLVDNADPRLSVIAYPNKNDVYNGVVPGVAPDNVGDINLYSRIGERYREIADGFTPFMRYAEVKFIEAEANADQNAFEEAIIASCVENGIDAGDAASYASGFDVTVDEDLFSQKWVALFKQGHEAWAETRRTDIPQMDAAPASPYPGHNRPPFMFPYPTDESNLNSANLAPYAADVVDKFWGKQMWWDERTGVQ
ncbi:MAG TPA: SusD/RagB family nutrient-binding outer membrane lipoprotein [Salinivirga sp.]|uniref:SusD/RagB family nutrient-binding outer membrane lipoprotein n=1 Tax=Salinivirga sp. TaxID=1970192 RepID=UPI002B4742C0|nr:SusD/RagB family nutrient-binding outer membrane lipoprotein [Salinivirga sp.]HKK57870.1 SusD/RagB family nutrient-binding outer membrane lipoprotein [Salinivirga sp.]